MLAKSTFNPDLHEEPDRKYIFYQQSLKSFDILLILAAPMDKSGSVSIIETTKYNVKTKIISRANSSGFFKLVNTLLTVTLPEKM